MKNHARNVLIALLALMFFLSIIRLAEAVGPSINLPLVAVNAMFNYPGANSYWDITLFSVPSDCDVTSAIYVGWCCDQIFTINNGATLGVKLYSSYDPLNPYIHNVDPGDWNNVNYIINNKLGTKDDVQAAIWYFIDGGVYPAPGPARTMVDNANAYGGSFVPTHGQLLAVVLYLEHSQTTFIEVTVPTVHFQVFQQVIGNGAPTTLVDEYDAYNTPVSYTELNTYLAQYQWICTGFTGTGSAPASGTSNSVAFNILVDSTVTFYLQRQALQTFDASANVKTDGTGTIVTVTYPSFGVSTTDTVPVASLPHSVWADSYDGTLAYSFSPIVSSSVAGKQYRYSSFSGPASGYDPSTSYTVTGTYVTQYQLTVNNGGHGTTIPAVPVWYDIGSPAPFSISPTTVTVGTTQYVFTGWTGVGSGSYSGSASSSSATMSGPITETANWKTQYYLTVTSQYDTPTGAGWYDAGSVVTASVAPSVGHYLCIGFTGTGSAPSAGSDPTVTFTINMPSSVTFNWQYTVVGGEWGPITLQAATPISTIQLLAPWIVLALAAATSAFAAYRRFLKKRW